MNNKFKISKFNLNRLEDNEQVIAVAKGTYRPLFVLFFVSQIFLLLIIGLPVLLLPEMKQYSLILLYLYFIANILLVFRLIPLFIKVKTTELVCTDRRLFGKSGLIFYQSIDFTLDGINGLSFQKNFLDIVSGSGAVYIYSYYRSYSFSLISYPDKFIEKING
jgi:hypothetical protein